MERGTQMFKGKYIVLEGIEGSGKGTQATRLVQWLGDFAKVIKVREPGQTPTGLKIREILLDKNSDLATTEELLLFFADRGMTMRGMIVPALERGEYVVADRSYLSTFAYQIAGRENKGLLPLFEDLLTRVAHKIDLALVLDLPAEQGLAGVNLRQVQTGQAIDRFEQEQIAFHERVRNGYLEGARRYATVTEVIDASVPEEAVWRQVILHVRRHMLDE